MSDTAQIDWRTCGADELTAYIRQLLGWKKHIYSKQRYAHNDWDGPDGTIHDGDTEDCPPDFGNDADAALSLPIDDDMQWVLFRNGNGYCARLEDMVRDVGFSENTTYAEAISRAWLAWHERAR